MSTDNKLANISSGVVVKRTYAFRQISPLIYYDAIMQVSEGKVATHGDDKYYNIWKNTSRRTSVIAVSDGATRSFNK